MKEGKAIKCPSCGAGIKLDSAELKSGHVCEYCGASVIYEEEKGAGSTQKKASSAKKNYQSIIDSLEKELKSKGFKLESSEGVEYLTNGKKAFMVEYESEQKLINLQTADLAEGEEVDWRTIDSWLMEQNATDSDKNSIANDFIDAALEAIGEKASLSTAYKVDMPSKKKNAETIDIESFSARFLAMFPEHKNAYKSSISRHGEFLADTFFRKVGAEELNNALKEGSNKKITKYLELLNTSYTGGDKDTSALVLYTIFGSYLFGEYAVDNRLFTNLEKHEHLLSGVKNLQKILSKPKNLKKYS